MTVSPRWTLAALGLLLAACQPAPTPTAAPQAATAFIETRVAVVLTQGAAAATATARALPSPTPSATPTATNTNTVAPPTATPTITPTPAATPLPTLELGRFPRPPDVMGGEAHLWLARPIAAGGNVFVASNYRYGATWEGQLETHHGVEFANPAGVPVAAVAPGVIYYAGSDAERQFGPQLDFYGNLVVLQLAQTWQGRPVFALYGHLETVAVTTGQAVGVGEVLGTVGDTGVAYGAHLHFEVRLDNGDSYWETRNPELWIAPGPGRGALAIRVTNARGQHLPGMRVVFVCSDGAPRVLDTYWDPGVNPDEAYGENAGMTDVPAGFCRFETPYQDQVLRAEATVQAGGLTLVWLRP